MTEKTHDRAVKREALALQAMQGLVGENGYCNIVKATKVYNELSGENIAESAFRSLFRRARLRVGQGDTLEPSPPEPVSPDALPVGATRHYQKGGSYVVESNDPRINTVEDVIKALNIDMAIWKVESFSSVTWDTTMKLETKDGQRPFSTQNARLKVTFKRVVSEKDEATVRRLLDRLESKSPIVPPTISVKAPDGQRRALEVCIFDPHYGMRSFAPASDAEWNTDLCKKLIFEVLSEIVSLSGSFAPYEKVILPLGNDFFHVDNVFHTTTQGTGQPEADSWHATIQSGKEVAIAMIDMLLQVADVHVPIIPGNHDRQSSFMLGLILDAYYRNDGRVTIDCSSRTYKCFEYGVNLIGYEHGHSISAIRLAALMANEWPEAWARTKYREWHLGDQHRKGSSKPSAFEEQGVSVEYLPGLVPPNEWHAIKSYNHQQRGAMAFIWSYKHGPVARYQVNVDRITNGLLGKG